MTPASVKASYRRLLAQVGEPVLIRRYTGSGPNRPKFECQVRARVVDFRPEELIGGLIQGDRNLIVLAQDLIDAQFPLQVDPITGHATIGAGANWQAVVRGKAMTIKAVDDNTRRVAGELVAYQITVGG